MVLISILSIKDNQEFGVFQKYFRTLTLCNRSFGKSLAPLGRRKETAKKGTSHLHGKSNLCENHCDVHNTHLVVLDESIGAGGNAVCSCHHVIGRNQGPSTICGLTSLTQNSNLPRPRPWGCDLSSNDLTDAEAT